MIVYFNSTSYFSGHNMDIKDFVSIDSKSFSQKNWILINRIGTKQLHIYNVNVK